MNKRHLFRPFIYALFIMTTAKGLKSTLSVMSWNVNGLRSLLRHDSEGSLLRSLVESKRPDFICLQETKLQEVHTQEMASKLDQFFRQPVSCYWNSSRGRKGYSGTAIICMEQNFKSADLSVSYQLGDDAGDLEGRLITVEGENFSLTNVYVPNSGDGMFVIYLVFLYLLFKCEICVCRTKTIRI